MSKPRADHTGEKFERWEILIDNIAIDWKRYRWCKCDCGTYRLIRKDQRSKSCGCYSSDVMSQRIGEKHPNWKGGGVKGSEAWAKNILRTNADTSRRMGWAEAKITIPELMQRYKDFDGVCCVCQKAVGEANKHDLAMDHCHETGLVRGFICKHCNCCIGWYENNKSRIEDYLQVAV